MDFKGNFGPNSFLNKHKIALTLALVIAILFVLPQLVFMFDSNYQGIQMLSTDAEYFYLSRANEVYEGDGDVSNPYLEDKDTPAMYPILGENIIARTGLLLNLSVVETMILFKAVLPFLMFLLIYAFVFRIFGSKQVAILSTVLIMLGYNLLDGFVPVKDLLTLSVNSNSFLPYTRPPHPIISSFFIFGGLYLIYLLSEKINDGLDVSWKYVLALGFVSGVSIYSYIYAWSFLVVFLGLYGVYFLFKKDFEAFWVFVKVAIINLLITIPYWMNVLEARAHPFYTESSLRVGLINTHAPIFSVWLLLVTLAILFLWPKEELWRKIKPFFLIFIFSLWVAINQQVISGYELHHAHYHFYIAKPLISIVLASLFVYWSIRLFKAKSAILSLILLLVLFINGVLIQKSAYASNYEEFASNQKYQELSAYLNENYTEPVSIWSTPEDALILPVYTNHNFPNHDGLGYSILSNDYLIDRLLLGYKLQNVKPENFRSILEEDKLYASKRTFLMHYRQSLGSYESIPDEVLDNISEKYQSFYDFSYNKIFDSLGIDIFLYEDLGGANLFLGLKELKEVDRIENYIVYGRT